MQTLNVEACAHMHVVTISMSYGNMMFNCARQTDGCNAISSAVADPHFEKEGCQPGFLKKGCVLGH